MWTRRAFCFSSSLRGSQKQLQAPYNAILRMKLSADACMCEVERSILRIRECLRLHRCILYFYRFHIHLAIIDWLLRIFDISFRQFFAQLDLCKECGRSMDDTRAHQHLTEKLEKSQCSCPHSRPTNEGCSFNDSLVPCIATN